MLKESISFIVKGIRLVALTITVLLTIEPASAITIDTGKRCDAGDGEECSENCNTKSKMVEGEERYFDQLIEPIGEVQICKCREGEEGDICCLKMLDCGKVKIFPYPKGTTRPFTPSCTPQPDVELEEYTLSREGCVTGPQDVYPNITGQPPIRTINCD